MNPTVQRLVDAFIAGMETQCLGYCKEVQEPGNLVRQASKHIS